MKLGLSTYVSAIITLSMALIAASVAYIEVKDYYDSAITSIKGLDDSLFSLKKTIIDSDSVLYVVSFLRDVIVRSIEIVYDNVSIKINETLYKNEYCYLRFYNAFYNGYSIQCNESTILVIYCKIRLPSAILVYTENGGAYIIG